MVAVPQAIFFTHLIGREKVEKAVEWMRKYESFVFIPFFASKNEQKRTKT